METTDWDHFHEANDPHWVMRNQLNISDRVSTIVGLSEEIFFIFRGLNIAIDDNGTASSSRSLTDI